MSDGITDSRRAGEACAKALRERLVAEDLLYGVYDPATCPNHYENAQGDPFCCPTRKCVDDCGLDWCEPCQAYFGPWGAWRAVLGSLLASEYGWYIVKRGDPRRDWQIAHSHWGLLDAVGWSP